MTVPIPNPQSLFPDLEWLSAAMLDAARDDLVALLQACVHGGASLGFLAPLSDSEARAYWDSLAPHIEARQSGRARGARRHRRTHRR